MSYAKSFIRSEANRLKHILPRIVVENEKSLYSGKEVLYWIMY